MAAEVGKSHMYSSPAAPPCIQYEGVKHALMNPVGGVNSHARPSHSTRVPGHLSRGAVPPEVSDGGVLLPAGPGGGPHLFCMGGTAILGGFRSLPYKLYGVFRHTFCMAKHLHISKSGQGLGGGGGKTTLMCIKV